MKIISFDIEATNLDADFGYVICFAYKELGMPAKVLSISDYDIHETEPWNDKLLIQDILEIIKSADIVVSYYGKGFDWGFLNARLLANGLEPLPEVPHVDLYWTAKRILKISSRSMANVGEQLNLKERKMYIPRKTWIMAQGGHLPSIRELSRRCKSDTLVLEQTYLRLRSQIRLHPRATMVMEDCRFCGSNRIQRRGYHVTSTGRRIRVQCQNPECLAWDTRKIPIGNAQ